jgi:hypothetical protein
MGELLVAGFATGYGALLVWLTVRVVNRPSYWVVAVTIAVLVGASVLCILTIGATISAWINFNPAEWRDIFGP